MNFSIKLITRLLLIVIIASLGLGEVVYSQTRDTLIAQYNVIQCNNLIQDNADNPNFVILDVRTAGEHNPEHIWGSINRNYYASNFTALLDALPRHKLYLVHCKSGARSTAAWNMMQEMNFTQIVNMIGGMNMWEAANYPVTSVFEPLLMAVSDTVLAVDMPAVGSIDTISLTITNRWNSSLSFDAISSLSGTEFSTDFDLDTSLTGAEDYTFNVYYEPQDTQSDTIDILLESNGGSVSFHIETIYTAPTEFTLLLPAGWSGVSSWIAPANANVEDIFAPIVDDLVILKNFDGVYWPDAAVNTIGNWDSHSGYMIKMESEQQLTFSGEMQSNKNLELSAGWNYLPMLINCEISTDALLSQVSGQVQIVKEVAGSKVFWPEFGIATLDVIVPGKAYFILVDEDVELNFTDCP